MRQSSHSSPQKKPKWRKVLFWVLIALLALLLCGLMAVFAIYNYTMDKINRPDPTETYISEQDLLKEQATEEQPGETYPEVDPNSLHLPGAEGLIGQKDEIVNILLVGQDRRPGEGRARSDSMILCSFNKTQGTLQMISFLRDLYVPIPGGYMDNRLNASYALGGFDLLDETLETNFGIQIDGNVEVDFSGFEKIVDILGGVDVNLTQAEVDYLDRNGSLGLVAGMNHLDGKVALSYSRIRYLDSDFGRTGRQRNVLTAMLNSVRNMDLATAKALVDDFLPLVTTDLTNTQILNYLVSLLPMLPGAEVSTMYVPAEDTYYYAMIRGMSVLVPDMNANRELLAEALGE